MNRSQVRYTEAEQSSSCQTDGEGGIKTSCTGFRRNPQSVAESKWTWDRGPKPMGILPLKEPASRMVGADKLIEMRLEMGSGAHFGLQ